MDAVKTEVAGKDRKIQRDIEKDADVNKFQLGFLSLSLALCYYVLGFTVFYFLTS